MKDILKDILYNYKWQILGGISLVALLTLYVTDFDNETIIWYYTGVTIASGGGVACIIYAIKKLLKK